MTGEVLDRLRADLERQAPTLTAFAPELLSLHQRLNESPCDVVALPEGCIRGYVALAGYGLTALMVRHYDQEGTTNG